MCDPSIFLYIYIYISCSYPCFRSAVFLCMLLSHHAVLASVAWVWRARGGDEGITRAASCSSCCTSGGAATKMVGKESQRGRRARSRAQGVGSMCLCAYAWVYVHAYMHMYLGLSNKKLKKERNEVKKKELCLKRLFSLNLIYLSPPLSLSPFFTLLCFLSPFFLLGDPCISWYILYFPSHSFPYTSQAIIEREAQIKKEKGLEITEDFVTEAQHRIDEEARRNYTSFSFRSKGSA